MDGQKVYTAQELLLQAKRRITQTHLANILLTTQSSISSIMSGKRQASAVMARRIADLLYMEPILRRDGTFVFTPKPIGEQPCRSLTDNSKTGTVVSVEATCLPSSDSIPTPPPMTCG